MTLPIRTAAKKGADAASSASGGGGGSAAASVASSAASASSAARTVVLLADVATGDAATHGAGTVPPAYTLGRVLGRGSFGVVHEATVDDTGETIAVKQISLSGRGGASGSGKAEAFDKEVELLRAAAHPNVVRVLGVHRTPQVLSLLMEYVPCSSLDARLKTTGPFSEPLIKRYLRQLFRALAHCHALGVVHRDLKSANVLLTSTGELKIADFGSARLFSRADLETAASLGYNYTPLWLAPEVLNGMYSSKVDVWSAGCVAVEMGTGLPPWAERSFENAFAALYFIGNSDAAPAVPDTLSAPARDFLARCLVRDPSGRMSAAEALRHPFLAN